MYHEITTRERSHKRRRRIVVLLLCAVLVALAVLVGQVANNNAREQGASALRQSILNAAIRCCAIEGSYPLTLDRLEQDYGLRINHKDYTVTYEAFASNIVPSVVVVPK